MLPPELDELNEYDETEDGEESTGSGGKIVRWLILLGLGILFAPLYLMGTTLKDSKAALQHDLDGIQATLSATPSPNPTEATLTGQLAQVRGEVNALNGLQSTLAAGHVNWPSVMSIIGSYDQGQMGITGMSQTGISIALRGQANDENAIMAYANLLRQSNQFSDVAIEAITFHAAPTVLPPRAGTTPQPAQPTPSAYVEFTLQVQLKTGATP